MVEGQRPVQGIPANCRARLRAPNRNHEWVMANGRGKGWRRSVQVFVQIVWTLNPKLYTSSVCGQNVLTSCCVGVRSGLISRCLFSLGLCMDVFVAVCFYLPDILFFLVMMFLPDEIKEWSYLCYLAACSPVWFSLWLWQKIIPLIYQCP